MDRSNRDDYGPALQLLDIRDEDRVLEIGYGSGLAIRQIVEQNRNCQISGIDFSELMRERAFRNNRAGLAAQRVRLLPGDFRTHDFGQDSFTKIYAINVIYFWEDLNTVLAKVCGLLTPHGRLVLFWSSPARLDRVPFAADGVFNKYPLEEVKAALAAAGFASVSHRVVAKGGRNAYFVTAEK